MTKWSEVFTFLTEITVKHLPLQISLAMKEMEQNYKSKFTTKADEVSTRLLTARAVLRPQTGPAVREDEPKNLFPRIAREEKIDLIEPLKTGSLSGYRIELFAVGREKLAAVFPEQSEVIEQLADLQIEELAMQMEAALAEIYKMTLRAVLLNYLGNGHP